MGPTDLKYAHANLHLLKCQSIKRYIYLPTQASNRHSLSAEDILNNIMYRYIELQDLVLFVSCVPQSPTSKADSIYNEDIESKWMLSVLYILPQVEYRNKKKEPNRMKLKCYTATQ